MSFVDSIGKKAAASLAESVMPGAKTIVSPQKMAEIGLDSVNFRAAEGTEGNKFINYLKNIVNSVKEFFSALFGGGKAASAEAGEKAAGSAESFTKTAEASTEAAKPASYFAEEAAGQKVETAADTSARGLVEAARSPVNQARQEAAQELAEKLNVDSRVADRLMAQHEVKGNWLLGKEAGAAKAQYDELLGAVNIYPYKGNTTRIESEIRAALKNEGEIRQNILSTSTEAKPLRTQATGIAAEANATSGMKAEQIKELLRLAEKEKSPAGLTFGESREKAKLTAQFTKATRKTLPKLQKEVDNFESKLSNSIARSADTSRGEKLEPYADAISQNIHENFVSPVLEELDGSKKVSSVVVQNFESAVDTLLRTPPSELEGMDPITKANYDAAASTVNKALGATKSFKFQGKPVSNAADLVAKMNAHKTKLEDDVIRHMEGKGTPVMKPEARAVLAEKYADVLSNPVPGIEVRISPDKLETFLKLHEDLAQRPNWSTEDEQLFIKMETDIRRAGFSPTKVARSINAEVEELVNQAAPKT